MDQYLDPETLVLVRQAQALKRFEASGAGGLDDRMGQILDKLADLPALIRPARGDDFDEQIDEILSCMGSLDAKRD
jgi:hypothetical protein